MQIELDQALDQYNIQLAMQSSVRVLQKYSYSEIVCVIFNEYDKDSLKFRVLCLHHSNYTNQLSPEYFPESNQYFNDFGDIVLIDAKKSELLLKQVYGTEFISQSLFQNTCGENKLIGRAYIGLAEGENEGFILKQLLLIFGNQIDSRLVNYHILKNNLERFLDPKLVNVILQHPENCEELLIPQNHVIAMVYADIVGFSKMCSYIERELILDLINLFISKSKDIIFKNHGVFDKAIGDCIVSLIGPPFYNDSSKQNVINAINIGLGISKLFKELNDEPMLKNLNNKEPLSVSVGINMGQVLVGGYGMIDNVHGIVDYTAIGHEMNLAARVQSCAKGDEVLITQAVLDVIDKEINVDKAIFKTEVAGIYEIKNMGKVNLFRVCVD
jgi:class 3 adenylate cyclase